MLRLLLSKAHRCKDFRKPSKPCHVGMHWIALAEYSRMSTHLLGFQSFAGFLHHFEKAKLATSSIRVKAGRVLFSFLSLLTRWYRSSLQRLSERLCYQGISPSLAPVCTEHLCAYSLFPGLFTRAATYIDSD